MYKIFDTITNSKDNKKGNKNKTYEGKKSIENNSKNEKQHVECTIDLKYGLKLNCKKKSLNDCKINLKGISSLIINSIRRTIMADVKTLSIEKVYIYKNSTVFSDEIISHRLGLVPIFINTELLRIYENRAKNFPNIIINLDINNKIYNKTKISIFSEMLNLMYKSIDFDLYKNQLIFPVYRDILILKINPGQEIFCECHCLISSGLNHAKFSPVGTIFYRMEPYVKILKEIISLDSNSFLKVCPTGVFEVEKLGNLSRIYVKNSKFCTFCKECIKMNFKSKCIIKIGRNKVKINLIIESTGVSSPENLFKRAIDLLIGKSELCLENVIKNFKSHVNFKF